MLDVIDAAQYLPAWLPQVPTQLVIPLRKHATGVCCTDRWHLIWCAGRPAWKDVAVPKPYPEESRDDIVRVARNREFGVTIGQMVKDFGVHPMTLTKWMRNADR